MSFSPEKAGAGMLAMAGAMKAKDVFKSAGFQGYKDLTTKFLDYAKGKTTLSKQEILDFARRPELKKGEADLLLKKLDEFAPENPLAAEARKYKTAEEFVKAQGKIPATQIKKEMGEYLGYNKNDTFIESNLPISKIKNKDTIESFGGRETQDGSEIVELMDSIRKDGFTSRIVVDETGKVLDGNHRIVAARELGIKDLPVYIKTKSQLTDLYNQAKGGKLPAQDFADSIRRDLLELKPVKVKEPQHERTTIDSREYGRIGDSIKAEEKGILGKNYEEVVFESPITTNGSSHYPNSKNYFAHARGDEVVENGKKVWREQEIQSDLLQKEGMERMRYSESQVDYSGAKKALEEGKEVRALRADPMSGESELGQVIKNQKELDRSIGDEFVVAGNEKQTEQLSPFTNDRFGERIMRERIREKASKGYEKYRLPTGETIGKIEGFEERSWSLNRGEGKPNKELFPEDFKDLKIGDTVNNSTDNLDYRQDWIITDILGDGRFKAIPSNNTSLADIQKQASKETIERLKETFDLTGKSNPQYRRYENWGKFLKNKYGGKEVVDPQGNKWVEIDLKPEYKRMPVEAFGVGGLAISGTQAPDKNQGESWRTDETTLGIPRKKTDYTKLSPSATLLGKPRPKGTLSQRHNNPGMLIFMEQPGAEKGEQKGENVFWAKFKNADEGLKAFERDTMAKLRRNPDMTLREFVEIRSPRHENDLRTTLYNIVDELKDLRDSGVIKSLLASQLKIKDVPMDRLLHAIAKSEGYYANVR